MAADALDPCKVHVASALIHKGRWRKRNMHSKHFYGWTILYSAQQHDIRISLPSKRLEIVPCLVESSKDNVKPHLLWEATLQWGSVSSWHFSKSLQNMWLTFAFLLYFWSQCPRANLKNLFVLHSVLQDMANSAQHLIG